MHVVVPFDLKEALPFQETPVAQDFLSTDAQSKEQCDDDRNEQERRNVLARPERVVYTWCSESHEPGKQQRQRGSLQGIDEQILGIARFGQDISFEVGQPLRPPIRHLGCALHRLAALRCRRQGVSEHDGVEIVPLLGRGAARLGFSTVLVHRLRFHNVKELLWVDVSTSAAFAFIGVNAAGQGIEVLNGVQRVAPKNGMPSHIQQEQLVKHLEEVGTGLVEHGEHQLTREGQFLQQVEDLLAVSA